MKLGLSYSLPTLGLLSILMLPLAGHADRKKPGAVFKDCKTCPEMVVIPAGSFKMGGKGSSKEKPVHEVKIGYSFAVGKYEVTQAEWEGVMGKNPSEFKGARKPVENVSWEDAKSFIKKLSEQTGKEYRLLSESEWEYMARAGSTTKYPWGDEIDSSKAKYKIKGSERGTVPVGSYSANAFGVYDTVGNVADWVEDCWHETYKDAPTDGSARLSPWWNFWSAWLSAGEGDCKERVSRGGSWLIGPGDLRSASRLTFDATGRSDLLGFRIARGLSSIVMLPLAVHADTKKPGAVFKDCETCPEMLVIPAGSFKMGGTLPDEKPVHKVTIGYDFAVGRYEVTQAEWEAVMGRNPSFYKDARKPVERVSWEDAKSFVKKLSEQTGKEYRLLSESEWEYMARAGSTTRFPWGDEIDSSKARYTIEKPTVFDKLKDLFRGEGTVPVGSYSANAFGVYDTVGNVSEWVEDCYHKSCKTAVRVIERTSEGMDTYTQWQLRVLDAPIDGSAWLDANGANCKYHVTRGGSYIHGVWPLLGSAARHRHTGKTSGIDYIGFRIARTFSQ